MADTAQTAKTAPQLMTQRATLRVMQLERRTLDGREYAVAPCIAVAAGVLNGQLLTADEIAYSAEGWNGRPVSVRHPKQLGSPVTANSPAVVEAQVIGTTFNARMDGDRLRVELWVDVEKCRRLGGDALAVLEALDSETPLDVSTGYFCEVEEAQGSLDGVLYRGIQHNIIPDHIAVLPDERGACSWEDGCGAPRVNSQTDKEEVMPDEIEAPVQEPTAAQAGPVQEAPVAGVEAPALAAQEAGCASAPQANAEAYSEAEATEDTGSEEGDAEEDGGADVESPVVVAQEDSAAGGEQWAELGALINDMGGVEAFRTALAQAFDVAMLVQEMGGLEAVKGLFGALKANADKERMEMIDRLAANSACAFSAEELSAMDTAALEKLERSMRPAHYGVRANARAGTVAPEWRVLPPPSTVPQASAA